MAASALDSPKAVEVSGFVVRAFVKFCETIASHKEFARKTGKPELKFGDHDEQIIVPVEAIKQLMDPKLPRKIRRKGFHTDRAQRIIGA